MSKSKRLYSLLALIMSLVLASGCLRSADSGSEVSLPESLPRSTDTPRPTFTPSPGPTDTPMVITEQVTSVQVITSTPSMTSTPVSVAQAQSDDVGIISEQSTTGDTQTDSQSQTGAADAPAAQQSTQQPQAAQQQGPTPTLDPLYVQATELVLEATQEAANLTATAEGPVQPVPTFTPTQDLTTSPTPTPSPTPAPALPGQDCIHEVSAGENLFRLSLRYGVTVNEIARASGVQNVERIVVGQKLTIPGCGTTGVTPPPTSIPTATRTPAGGATAPGGGTTPGGRTYMVQQGDTLFEISLRFGVPVNDIVAANPNITNPDVIDFNEEIVIPGV